MTTATATVTASTYPQTATEFAARYVRDAFDTVEFAAALKATNGNHWTSLPYFRRARLQAWMNSGSLPLPCTPMGALAAAGQLWDPAGVAALLNAGFAP